VTEPVRLLVDAGNSRIKWALVTDGGLDAGEPFPSEAAGLARWLDDHWSSLPTPATVAVSNVAGAVTAAALAGWIARQWQLEPHFAQVQARGYGIATRYQPPERLGVDRWLALVGARAAFPGALCVVDCGTAITLDALDADGVHRGGLIAPGLGLMHNALVQAAPGLSVAAENHHGVLATATAAGIAGGIRQAALGLIERSLALIAAEWHTEPLLLLTGGDAAGLGGDLRIPYRHRPHLVLEGLLAITESAR
jgi:type III pantothenate kinase